MRKQREGARITARMRNENKSRIPLCRSDFLQDLTIALGRRSLYQIRKNWLLTFEVSKEYIEGASLERLGIEAKGLTKTPQQLAVPWTFKGPTIVNSELMKIAVWENAMAWMYYRESKTTRDSPAIEISADLTALTPEGIADLIRATLTVPALAHGEWKKADIFASAMKTERAPV